jgi:hypothetical protein
MQLESRHQTKTRASEVQFLIFNFWRLRVFHPLIYLPCADKACQHYSFDISNNQNLCRCMVQAYYYLRAAHQAAIPTGKLFISLETWKPSLLAPDKS